MADKTQKDAPKAKYVEMVRNPEDYAAPHSATVHEDEVKNYRNGGFVTVDEATFELPHPKLPLGDGQKEEDADTTSAAEANKQPGEQKQAGWGQPGQKG